MGNPWKEGKKLSPGEIKAFMTASPYHILMGDKGPLKGHHPVKTPGNPRRLATAEPTNSGFSLVWAPLVFLLLVLAYMVVRRVTAPRRAKKYDDLVNDESVEISMPTQAHE